MFEKNVAAIYGYSNGPRNLEGSKAGDRVFAYMTEEMRFSCLALLQARWPGGLRAVE
jgi:hypothetical protein